MCAKLFKEFYPELRVIWEGITINRAPANPQKSFIDIVIRGQGEIPLKKSLEKFRKKDPLMALRVFP